MRELVRLNNSLRNYRTDDTKKNTSAREMGHGKQGEIQARNTCVILLDLITFVSQVKLKMHLHWF